MFVNVQTAWAGGSGGSLLKTTNRGFTWEVVTLPTRIFAHDVFFINEQRGWTGGQGYVGALSSLLVTTDGGITWTTQLEDSVGDFRSIVFVN